MRISDLGNGRVLRWDQSSLERSGDADRAVRASVAHRSPDQIEAAHEQGSIASVFIGTAIAREMFDGNGFGDGFADNVGADEAAGDPGADAGDPGAADQGFAGTPEWIRAWTTVLGAPTSVTTWAAATSVTTWAAATSVAATSAVSDRP